MHHLGTVPLQTRRLVLRRMGLDDCHAMYENWACDPAVTRALRWNPHRDWTVTAEFLYLVEQQYDDPAFYQWGICLRDATLIGSISLQPGEGRIDAGWHLPASFHTEPLWEAGYCLGRAWWGQGYATEALAAVVDFWFDEVQAPFLTACHAVDNPASGHVMTKCGFQYDHDTVCHRFDGTPVPCHAYHLLNTALDRGRSR